MILAGGHAVPVDELAHAGGQDPGLPGAGPRKNETGALEVLDGRPLFGVQVL